VVEVEARGSGLEGTYAVWLGAGSAVGPLESPFTSQAKVKSTQSPDGLDAHIKAVPDGSRVKLWLLIAPGARVGFHHLGVVNPAGVSGTVSFWVGDQAVISESDAPHSTTDTAQPIKWPVVVNGRISESGQLDYYAFEAAREQTVGFELISVYGT